MNSSSVSQKEKKVLFSNFFSLMVVQGLNFILPLLVIPYLLHILGVELFGLLAMATALINYFLIVSDYGFNITATREIAVYRDSSEKLNEIFSAVMSIKIFLMVAGFLILTLLLALFPKLGNDALIYLLTFGMVVGQVFFPIWFFQGMEKMGYIAILNIIAKSIFLLAIILFVKEPSDVYLVPIFNSLGFIVVGLISLFYAYKRFNIRFVWQPYGVLRDYFLMGWHVFLSKMAVVLYGSSNLFILGLFTSNTVVGYYAIASKVISALATLGETITQVLFPFLSKKWMQSREHYHVLFLKIAKNLFFMMVVVAILLAWWSNEVVTLLAGKEVPITAELLQIMSLSLLLFPMGALFSNSFVTQQQSVYVTKSTFWTLLVNLVLVSILIPLYGAYGLAVTVVIVQLFHFYLNNLYFMRLRKVALCVV